MKKIFLLMALAILLPLSAEAEGSVVCAVDGRSDILLVKDGWKLGLKKDNGSVIVPCEFEEVIPIEGSLSHFIISLGGKYGVVDEYGNILLNVKYSYIIPRLFGNKLLVQQGGEKVSDFTSAVSIADNDPYFLHIGSGENEYTVRYMEINSLEWLPYVRRFATNGQWGLADIRPNVSMIFPSYSMVSVCPDNDRYILMGYTFGGVSAYNIYDTEKETFLLSMEKKVQYSSIYLLEGGYFLVNGFLRRFTNPETNINVAMLAYVTDLNAEYVLCQSGKKVVLVAKESGKVVADDKNITHYLSSEETEDFFLKEGGSWILFSEGKRTTGFMGNIDFVGGYPVEVIGDNATVVIDGKPENKAKINFFAVAKDKKSILYINGNGDLVILEYPLKTERVLQEDCSGFETYYSNQDYVIVKKNDGSEDKAGLMDIKTGELLVPFNYSEIRPLYDDYYVATGEQKCLRRFSDSEFELPIESLCYNDFTHKPLCWISNSTESDSFALYSMEKDTLMTEYCYSGVDIAKYPGRMMMLGDDYVPFIQKSKKGIMDTEGNVVFPASYDQLMFSFTEGFCVVSDDNKFGCINPYTGVTLPCVYEDVGHYVFGRCIVKSDGLWGIADAYGNIIVPNKYRSIEDYFDDLDWLRKDHFTNGLTYGVLDADATPVAVEWFDNDGKILCKGTAAVPLVKTVVPEGLWDY